MLLPKSVTERRKWERKRGEEKDRKREEREKKENKETERKENKENNKWMDFSNVHSK